MTKQTYAVSVLLAMIAGLIVAYLTGEPVQITIPAPLTTATTDAVDAPAAVTASGDVTAAALPLAVTP